MADAIEIVGLQKAYDAPVLSGIDLTVDGGVFGLLGANGAGKTTLVSILTTLIRPDAGTARVAGLDVVRDAARVRGRIAVTGQQTALDDMLTGRENLVMMAGLLGLRGRSRSRADELIERFGLVGAAARPVRTYSGGMARRLDLAASLLLTTQTLDEAEELADRIAVLRGGVLVADGTSAQLRALVGGPRIVLTDAQGREVHNIETDGSAESVARAIARLDDAERGLALSVREPSLDDAFAALTGSGRSGRNDEGAAA